MFIATGSAEFRNAYLGGNNSKRYGGGIAIDGGTLGLLNCVLDSNWSVQGGGLNADGGALVFADSTLFTNNFTNRPVATNGTAIFLDDAGTSVFVSNCDFPNNGVRFGTTGGALFADDPLHPSTGIYYD